MWLVWIFFILALSSKETALTLPICLLLSEKFIFKNSLRNFLREYYPILLVAVIYPFLRIPTFKMLGGAIGDKGLFFVFSEIVKNFVFSFTAFLFSLDFMLIKDIYRATDTSFIDTFFNLLQIYPSSIIFILVAFLFYIVVMIKGEKLVYYCLGFIIITISSFLWLIGFERYLYLPSAGFCILLTYIALKIYQAGGFRRWLVYAGVLLFLGYNIMSLKQKEGYWQVASEISRKAVEKVIELTKNLPSYSEVYLRNLPDNYKGAWIFRGTIQDYPELILKRQDLKFHKIYEEPIKTDTASKVFVYLYQDGELVLEK